MLIAELHARHPFAVLRRPPTGQYNCHGLTFANRRTCVLDSATIRAILEDDGYRTIRFRDVLRGDVAVFVDGGDVSHTGVVLEVVEGEPPGQGLRNIRIMSKWGQAGEYFHAVNEGPYSTDEVEYMTDRPA